MKAFFAMDVTSSGMTVFLHPRINFFVDFSMMALQLERESYFPFLAATPIYSSASALFESPNLKASSPILVTVLGMVMDCKAKQSSKALIPMVSTPSEIVTVLSLLHSPKVKSIMLFTLEGMLIEVRLVHPKKADSPMLFTVLGMVTD